MHDLMADEKPVILKFTFSRRRSIMKSSDSVSSVCFTHMAISKFSSERLELNSLKAAQRFDARLGFEIAMLLTISDFVLNSLVKKFRNIILLYQVM